MPSFEIWFKYCFIQQNCNSLHREITIYQECLWPFCPSKKSLGAKSNSDSHYPLEASWPNYRDKFEMIFVAWNFWVTCSGHQAFGKSSIEIWFLETFWCLNSQVSHITGSLTNILYLLFCYRLKVLFHSDCLSKGWCLGGFLPVDDIAADAVRLFQLFMFQIAAYSFL